MIEYLQEEVRVYKEHFEGRRILFTDDQRRRLAIKARALDAKVRKQVANIATPDTLMRWFRQLVAKKYDGSAKRGPGRSRLRDRIADLVLKMAEENLSWGYTRKAYLPRVIDLDLSMNAPARLEAVSDTHGSLFAAPRPSCA